MSILLRLVGVFWAIIGVGNLVTMPWTEGGNETLLGFGLIFNMLLFILPGLIVYGIGSGMARRRVAVPTAAPQQQSTGSQQAAASTEDRLAKLQDLKHKGLINENEYETRRKEIIDEL